MFLLSSAALLAAPWLMPAVGFHLAFGVCMVGTAAFSHHPWLSGVPFDPVEDFLHSLTATVMGFAFAFGVVVRFLQREKTDIVGRLLDGTAVAAATFLPLLMATQPEIMGDIAKQLDNQTWEAPIQVAHHRRWLAIDGLRIPVLSLAYEYEAYLKLGRMEKANIIRQFLQKNGRIRSS